MVSTQAYDASLPDEGDLLLPRLIMIIVMMITIITNFPPGLLLTWQEYQLLLHAVWRCCGGLGCVSVCVKGKGEYVFCMCVCVCVWLYMRVCVNALISIPHLLFPVDYKLA